MKTSDLLGPALSWAVGEIEKLEWDKLWKTHRYPDPTNANFSLRFEPHLDWAQGGPIIERERINLVGDGGDRWMADDSIHMSYYGPTPLIASMRCYVASKLGDEVEIPEELQ